MKVGDKTVRDRRGAAQRILDQVQKDGTMPRYANWRTISKLKEIGAIHFSTKSWNYKLGPAPAECGI